MWKWSPEMQQRSERAWEEELYSLDAIQYCRRGRKEGAELTLLEVCIREREFADRNLRTRILQHEFVNTNSVLQAETELREPAADPQLYVNIEANESIFRWATREGDLLRRTEKVLPQVEQNRTEIFVFPSGYRSGLEIDRPFFMEKTMFLLQGEVSIRVREFASANLQT